MKYDRKLTKEEKILYKQWDKEGSGVKPWPSRKQLRDGGIYIHAKEVPELAGIEELQGLVFGVKYDSTRDPGWTWEHCAVWLLQCWGTRYRWVPLHIKESFQAEGLNMIPAVHRPLVMRVVGWWSEHWPDKDLNKK